MDCYTSYAIKAFTDIQHLNEEMQLYLDTFVAYDKSKDMTDTERINELQTHIKESIDNIGDVFITYANEMRLVYCNFDSFTRFQFSNNAKDFVYSALNVTDLDYNNIISLSDITSTIFIKYINMKYIHDNLMDHLPSIMNIDNYDIDDKQICYAEKVVNIIDYIISIFYDSTESVDHMCDNENEILSMIKSYILELRIITIIIEFLESIEPV